MAEKTIDAKVILSLFRLVLINKDKSQMYIQLMNGSTDVFTLDKNNIIISAPRGYKKFLNGYKITNIDLIDESEQPFIKELSTK